MFLHLLRFTLYRQVKVKIDTHRIAELGKFAKIVPPAGSCHSEARGAV